MRLCVCTGRVGLLTSLVDQEVHATLRHPYKPSKKPFTHTQDTKSLKKAHRRADRIIEYAADVSLIASFHYKKKNFHLVKLLEVCTVRSVTNKSVYRRF